MVPQGTSLFFVMNNTITVKPGQTLSQIYGNDWQAQSGYKGDPTRLAVGTVLPAPKNFSSAANTSTPNGPAYNPPIPSAPSISHQFDVPSRPQMFPLPATKVTYPTSSQIPPVTPQMPQDTTKPQDWASQRADAIKPPVSSPINPVTSTAPTQPTQPVSPQAAGSAVQATTQAIKNGANPALLQRAKQYLGSDAYIGLCQAFVERATKGMEGIYASAKDAWAQQQDKAQTDLSKMKVGDSVYFAPDASNGFYGHTGVYAGNGQFISATDNGIKQVNLDDWMRTTGQKILGFIPNDGSSGGQDFGTPSDQNLGWIQQKAEDMSKTPGSVSGGGVSSPSFVDGTPDWVQPIIQKASEKYNIPPVMLSALLKKESGFNPDATSQVGAKGIAQFMPDTAKELGIDPSDPEQSIDGAAKYLRLQWDKFGKPELALAAYNSGPGNVQSFGGVPPFKETKDYVKGIMDMAGSVHKTAYDPILDILSEAKKS